MGVKMKKITLDSIFHEFDTAIINAARVSPFTSFIYSQRTVAGSVL
ncbi:MAG: hypothetical protein ACI8ZB_004814 [Desulforhopalus sp.]|jgi:hypothetical protein